MEISYKLALETLGYEVEIVDFNNMCNDLIGIGLFKRIGFQVDIIPSINRTNHLISKKIFIERPLAVIVFTNVKIYPGTIEYIKLLCKNVFFYWPDSIVNTNLNIFFNLNLYHEVFTHSIANVEIFLKHGISSTLVPFAGDTLMLRNHVLKPIVDKKFDFSFVGSFRPERLGIILELIRKFTNRTFLIVGPGWRKSLFKSNKNLYIVNEMVDLNTFLDYTEASKISLNIIDYLNFPSSNLRFFEIGLSSVPQISSFIPEFESKFINKKHVFYYKNVEDLIEITNYIFDNYEDAIICAKRFKNLISLSENYIQRSRLITEKIVI